MSQVDRLIVEIDPQEVLRLQGYRRPSDVPTPEVLEILRAAMAEAQQAFQPRWIYREFQVDSANEAGVCLQGGADLLMREVPVRWGAFSALGLAVCTIGDAIEDRIQSLFAAREFPVGFMLDRVGAVGVEALGEALHRQVCEERLARGLKVTPRESPGYAHWNIEEQRKVFALLPAETIGVQLNPYCIMMPRKSISFAVGIGPEARMGGNHSPCRSCDLRGCSFRRAPRRQAPATWGSGISPLILATDRTQDTIPAQD